MAISLRANVPTVYTIDGTDGERIFKSMSLILKGFQLVYNEFSFGLSTVSLELA